MKVEQYRYSSLEDFRTGLNLEHIAECNHLIQVFTGLVDAEEVKVLQKTLHDHHDKLLFMGVTTAGEIHESQVSSGDIVVSAMVFDQCEVSFSHLLDEDPVVLGQNLAKACPQGAKVGITFFDGLHTNGSEVLNAFNSIKPELPLTGGLAGDMGRVQRTMVFCREGVFDRGIVAAFILGDIRVFTDYQLNWQPIGKAMTVTKAEKNRLFELDHRPATEVYREYLGDRVGDGLPHSAVEFPLIHEDESGMEICRTFIHVFDDGSLLTIGNLTKGDQVRFAFGNVDNVVTRSKHSIQKYRAFRPEALFTFSCASRISFMQQDVSRELLPLESMAPTCGFFTYGEIFHRQSKHALLNITLTVLGLSEAALDQSTASHDEVVMVTDGQNVEGDNIFSGKHFMVLDALTHLSNKVISELDESKAVVEKAHRDIQASISFASLIQSAILPNVKEILPQYVKDYFAIWKPRDIVGGDIYFTIELPEYHKVVLMVIDGAGHGVPGAFVTMLVKAIENQIRADLTTKGLDPDPAGMLAHFNRDIKSMLKQSKGSRSNAGFDGGILLIDRLNSRCIYSGAKTDLYVLRDGALEVVKGDRAHVGFTRTKPDQIYTNHDIQCPSGTRLYLATDGYVDQEGPGDLRFDKGRLEEVLIELQTQPFVKHETCLINTLKSFQGSCPQSDDITFVGLELN
jgi:serine phosphatase RsbU (regulator of sigma subunit)